MIVWHVTNRRNVPAILVEGLRPDADGWDAGYVWFFDDRATADRSAAAGAWGGTRGRNAVLAVDVAGLDVIPDPHPGWGDHRDDHAFAHAGPIPPERVRLANREDPTPWPS